MFDEKQIKEILDYLKDTNGTVYLGCDSQRCKKQGEYHARYTCVLVVHIENLHGCKIFGYSEVARDYDAKQNKPSMRLMTEVYKVAELYLAFADALEDREVEIHLDINPNKNHNSNIVFQQAVGYIIGMCNIHPKTKPHGFAASYAADAGVRGRF